METLPSLINKIQEFIPDKNIAMRACRHLKKQVRMDLFSSKIWPRRNAEGHLYEALMYEELLCIAEENDLINKIIRTSYDVSRKQPKPKLGQNGFYYDPNGSIVIRGNGQDLAEIDIVLIDSNSNLIFIEVVISRKNLSEFEKEISFKKNLLKELTGQHNISFLIISSVDLSNLPSIRRHLRTPDNYYVCSTSVEKIKSMLNSTEVINYPRKKSNFSKLIDVEELNVNKSFNYKKVHDNLKDTLFQSIKRKEPYEGFRTQIGDDPIVSKLVLGGLYPGAIRYISQEKELKLNRNRISTKEIMTYFSKVILAVNLPDLRPILYLKVRKRYLQKKWKDTYLKLGPLTEDIFKFERNISSIVGFYLWLEDTNPILGKKITKEIINYCLRDEVFSSRKKFEKPNIIIRSKNSKK